MQGKWLCCCLIRVSFRISWKPLRVETGEFDLIDEDEYEIPKKGSP